MQGGEPGQERPVRRHRVQHPGRHEDHQVQEAEGGCRDSRGDERAARGPQQRAHHVGCGRRAGCELRGSEHPQVRHVGEQVHGHHYRDPEDQCARQILLRLDDLLGDEVGLLPAPISEEDRHESGTNGHDHVHRCTRRRGGRWRLVEGGGGNGERDTGDDQRGEGGELQDREDVLCDGRRLDSHVVDRRQ